MSPPLQDQTHSRLKDICISITMRKAVQFSEPDPSSHCKALRVNQFNCQFSQLFLAANREQKMLSFPSGQKDPFNTDSKCHLIIFFSDSQDTQQFPYLQKRILQFGFMKEQVPVCRVHHQITSMYVSFVVEKQREKCNICSVHSAILEKPIISCLHFPTEKVLEEQDTNTIKRQDYIVTLH